MIDLLGLSAGAALAAGLNIYATVFVLGLMHRLDMAHLPPGLEVLAHPVVLIAAAALYLVEFVADKVPYVDNVWDVVHTFIRPPAAAAIAFGAMAGVPESWRVAAALVAGTFALTSHGAKASARAAANASPEPFSNWVLSLTEDGLAVGLTWLAVHHPLLTLVVVLLLAALCVVLIVKLARFLVRIVRRVLLRSAPEPAGPPA